MARFLSLVRSIAVFQGGVFRGIMGEVVKVIKRTCDEPMARSKGLLPCDKNCKQCHACIEVLANGERRHWVVKGVV